MHENDARIRPIPFPYRSMLAICSDLDETPDRHVYDEIMRYLNTTQDTSMGKGVGLEVGNTLYFDMDDSQYAYWNTDDAGRAMARTLIQSGHIDCLHSYGDLATTREHAGRALDELARHDCKLEVWIDHAVAATNFGADIMHGHGDEKGHPAYHADLTISHGIQFVWRGRITSMIGQDAPPSLGGIGVAVHPIASSRTVAKEAAKVRLGRKGHAKYGPHGQNATMWNASLRDGQPVVEFLRSNPHWGGINSCDTGRGIGDVLTERMLNRFVKRQTAGIMYSHLGKVYRPDRPFNEAGVRGFQRLAALAREEKILVATTRRLLGYRRMVRELQIREETCDHHTRYHLQRESNESSPQGEWSMSDLDGLTLYVDDPERTELWLCGAKVEQVAYNLPDATGRASVSIPWKRLEYPDY